MARRKKRGYVQIIVIILIVTAINTFTVYTQIKNNNKNFEKIYTQKNISVQSSWIYRNNAEITVNRDSSFTSEFNLADLMTVRKILNITRNCNISVKSLKIILVSSENEILYKNTYENVKQKQVIVPVSTKTDGFIESMIRYEFNKNSIESEQISVLDSVFSGKELNVIINVEKAEEVNWAVLCFLGIIDTMNTQGAGICRYNLNIKKSETDILVMISKDFEYDDLLIWKSTLMKNVYTSFE